MWDSSSVTLTKCRSLIFVKDKFQGSPEVIKGLCGSSTDSHPIIFCWANLKGGNLNLVELFDQAEHSGVPPRVRLQFGVGLFSQPSKEYL